ncbi:MAG TPA: hypothetical protein VIU15_18995, partial [Streptomyces sp.]
MEEGDTTGVVTGTLCRDDGGLDRFLTSAARLYTRGRDGVRLATGTGRPAPLPTTPFQRQRYWLTATAPEGTRTGHPLLGKFTEAARTGAFVAGGRVAPAEQPWLADHAVNGTCVLAGTALLDLALRAAH